MMGPAIDLETLTVTFDLSKDSSIEEGYYSYKFYINPAGTTEVPPTKVCYDFYPHPSKITVTKDKGKLPKVKYFEVDDGYSDKFVLKFDYNPNYEYILKWISKVGNVDQPQKEKVFDDKIFKDDTIFEVYKETVTYIDEDDKEVTEELNIAEYKDKVNSGEIRKYTLIASNGIEIGKDSKEVKTLGTPKPSQVGYAYDKITVKWDSVQESSEDYKVSAYYADDKAKANLITSENCKITSDSEKKVYTCVLDKPDGYEDAKKAGKEIKFSVTATSKKQTEETTTSEISTHLLGPALLNVKTNTAVEANSSYLTLSWKEVAGAKGYLIHRGMYKDCELSGVESSDTYYYEVATDKLTIANAEAEPGSGKNINGVTIRRTLIEKKNEVYTLKDFYTEPDKDIPDGLGEYQKNQAKIAWGLPFGYMVVPVLDKNDCEMENLTFEEKSKVKYNNVDIPKSATIGYAVRVDAQKAEVEKTQRIDWDAPYYGSLYVPIVYKRVYGSNVNEWTRVKICEKGENRALYIPTGTEKRLPIEYAVKYVQSSSNSVDVMAESYMERLSKILENDPKYVYPENKTEPLNKGYLITTNFTAEYGGTLTTTGDFAKDANYYSEVVRIDTWDFNSKLIGPTGYVIEILNLDNSDGWVEVASYDGELSENSFKAKDLTDTTVEKIHSGIRLKPKSFAVPTDNGAIMGTTNGVLKVLRSARHYYRIKMLTNSAPEGIIKGSDREVYAYRQVTDEELTRMAMLVMSYGFYYNDSNSNVNLTDIEKTQYKYGGEKALSAAKGGGTASFTARERANSDGAGKYKQYFTFTEYNCRILTPSGELSTSPVSITNEQASCGIKGDLDNYIYNFRTTGGVNFNVTASDEALSVDYSAKINFVLSDGGYDSKRKTTKITITRNGITSEIFNDIDDVIKEDSTTFLGKVYLTSGTYDNTDRLKWVPMQIHPDMQYWMQSSEYGWW